MGIIKQLLGFRPDLGIVEDLGEPTVRVAATQLPHLLNVEARFTVQLDLRICMQRICQNAFAIETTV